jgi:hypothetical protein
MMTTMTAMIAVGEIALIVCALYCILQVHTYLLNSSLLPCGCFQNTENQFHMSWLVKRACAVTPKDVDTIDFYHGCIGEHGSVLLACCMMLLVFLDTHINTHPFLATHNKAGQRL